MTTSIANPLTVSAIRLYQRHISPIKGFRCAYGSEQGLKTCSAFGRHVFERYEASVAMSLLRRRFAACRQAYARLKIKMATPHASTRTDDKAKASTRPADRKNCREAVATECAGNCACNGVDALARTAGHAMRGAGNAACEAGVCDAAACCSL